MKINKAFWYKQNGKMKQAYSYDNPTYVKKFAQQYGGDAIDYLMVGDSIANVADVATEKKPTSVANDPRRFKVLVEGPDGFKEYDDGHEHLRDANNVAKTITKYYNTVLVVRKRFLDREEVGVTM